MNLGKDINGQVQKIDLAKLLRTRMFISASSGGGKSEAIRYLAEIFSEKVQVIILDPEGEFSTLRELYPFVLVGEGGETPAHPHTAAQVALTLLKLGASAVCDLYELRGNGRHEFVRNFIEAIVTAPKELWHPVVIFIDEAQIFCPENGYGESVAKMPIIDLCNLGRKRGFCPILATQRASKVSKNATEPLQNFAIGLTMPDDQKRVCDTFKVAPGAATREFSSQLELLEPGQFFMRGAAVSKLPVLVTINRAKTKAPKTGSSAAARKIPTPSAIKNLLPTLADIPQEAARKVETEKELRSRIAVLERQVRESERASTTALGKTITPERERMLLEQIKQLEKTAKEYERLMSSLPTVMEQNAAKLESTAIEIRQKAQQLRNQLADAQATTSSSRKLVSTAIDAVRDIKAPAKSVAAVSRPVSARAEKPQAAEGISGPEQKILDSIAWFKAIGIDAPENTPVAFMAGYSPSTSSYKNARGALNSKQLTFMPASGCISLTPEGEALANDPAIEVSNAGIQSVVLGKLPGPETKILKPLIEAFPNGMGNEALAEAAGYSLTTSSYKNARGALRTLGFIEYKGSELFARDVLFPEGA